MVDVCNICDFSQMINIEIVLLPAAVAALVAGYITFIEPRDATRIVRELNEQYSEDMPLQEVYCLYNRLLPASRRTHGETRNLADKLVDKVELRLCQHMREEGA